MDKEAGVIVNLGAPKNSDARAARTFLAQFLSDGRVLPLPFPLRQIVARLIARKRAGRYAEMLREISAGGAHPLLRNTESLAEKVGRRLGLPVEAAYRYGGKSVAETVERLRARGAQKIFFVPLYPHETLSTTHSARAEILRACRGMDARICSAYFDDALFIDAIARTVPPENDAVVASFHSVPLSHAAKTPYAAQCARTAELLAQRLGRDVAVAFQSKMGRGKWLGPNIESVVSGIVARGAKRVCVVAPSFACDCSETLVELDRQLRSFCAARGAELLLCPCLNDSDAHAEVVARLFIKIGFSQKKYRV